MDNNVMIEKGLKLLLQDILRYYENYIEND